MLTQIKLMYDVKSNKLNADYNYEMIFGNAQRKTAYEVLSFSYTQNF